MLNTGSIRRQAKLLEKCRLKNVAKKIPTVHSLARLFAFVLILRILHADQAFGNR